MKAHERLRVGDVIDVVCTRMEAGGAAVASIDAYELFVAAAVPHARVRVQVDHVSPHKNTGRTRAWAHVTQVLQQAPDARTPLCPAFGTCGGCIWQHLAYERQLEWKHALVQEALHAQNVSAAALPCVASPAREAYRNQGKYVVDADAKPMRLGGYAPRTHDVVDLTSCRLVERAVAVAIAAVRDHIAPLASHARHVVVRANEDGQALVTMVFRTPTGACGASALDFAAAVMNVCPAIVGVVANVNEQPGDVIFGDSEFVLRGQGFIDDRVAGAHVRLSPRAFFQVNRHVAALAYLQIAAFAETLGARSVWDVYAGVGTIAKVLRHALPKLESALCIEIRDAAVADARAMQSEDGAALTFIAGSAETALAAHAVPPDLIVLNPPRAGCDASVLQRVAAARPRGIAYLSCNPTTLARDLAALVAAGFKVERVTPFDMLPHTPHVETLALLTPNNGAAATGS